MFESPDRLGEVALLFLFSLPYAIMFVSASYTNIDDSFYIRSADNILRTPSNPYSTPYLCEGSDMKTTLKIIANGPFTYGYIALVKHVFGENEVKLHLSFCIFYLIALYSVYALAGAITGSGFLPALIFAANPYVLESSMTVTSDMPFTAFFLLSLVLFIKGDDKNDSVWLFGSGIVAGLAILTKYTGLLLPLLFVIYLAIMQKRPSDRLPYLLLPFFPFLLWNVHNLIFYNNLHFLEQTSWVKHGVGLLYDKFTSNFANMMSGLAFKISAQTISLFFGDGVMRTFAIGFIGLFPLAVVLAYLDNLKEIVGMGLFVLGVFLFANQFNPAFWTDRIFTLLFFAAGMLVFLKLTAGAFCRRNIQTVVAAWIFILMAYNIFIAPAIAAKYGLPTFALLGIFFADKLQKRYASRALPVIFASLVMFGLLFAYPIYQIGTFAKEQAHTYEALYSASNTWTCDPSYYLAKAGFGFLCNESQLRSGDRIIVSGPICGMPDSSWGTLFDISRTKANLVPVAESYLNMGPYREGIFQVFYVNDVRN